MSPEERLELFKTELNYIKNPKIKEFTGKVLLEVVPDYFFKIPPSSTSKYHPKQTHVDGGLVIHTRMAVRMAIEMFDFMKESYSDNMKDCIVSALILHDTQKNGTNLANKYTVADHPLVAVNQIKARKNICSILDTEILNTILDGILCHMTKWNTDYRSKKEVLPLPSKKYQTYIGMCDYIVSRKCIAIDFDS
jgi:hypothetical protein